MGFFFEGYTPIALGGLILLVAALVAHDQLRPQEVEELRELFQSLCEKGGGS